MANQANKIPVKRIIAVVVIALAAITIFIVLNIQNDRVLVLSGTVESQTIDIFSEVSGRVEEIFKKEGGQVEAGDPIIKIDSSLQELALDQAAEMVQIKLLQYEELQKGSREQQIAQAQSQLTAARADYDYWQDQLDRFTPIYTAGNLAQNEYDKIKYNLTLAAQKVEQARAGLSLLNEGATSGTRNIASRDLETARLQYEQAQIVLDKYTIKAPGGGVLYVLNPDIGELINPGAYIGSISDSADLWVTVYLPQKYLSLINLNDSLEGAFSASPDTKLNLKVSYIAQEAEFTPKNIQTVDARENTVFKTKLKVIDPPVYLKPGMIIKVSIPKTKES